MKKTLAVAVVAALAAAPFVHAQTIPLPAQTGVLAQNVSDLWWNPNESGWGLQLNQTGTTVFATLYVYAQNGQATWYTAQLTAQGNGVYSGPVYSSTGNWFGAGSFNPGQVVRTEVGTMTFAVQANGTAFLTYTINGTTVTRNVQRQSLGLADLTGTFNVQSTLVASGCASGQNGTTTGTSTFAVTNTGGDNLQINWTNPNGGTCSYTGTQTQSGSLGSLANANYVCTNGETGVANFSSLSSSGGMFSGYITSTSNSSACVYAGGFGGLNTQSVYSVNPQQ